MLKNAGIILFLLVALLAKAQKDTLVFQGLLNLQGRHQSGNLNQFGGNALAKATVSNTNWHTTVSANYTYANIEGFNAINDLWSNGILKYGYVKRIYPVGMLYSGFAKSFGINAAYVGGIGGGVNIIKGDNHNYLHLNIIGGYSTFNYAQVADVKGVVTNVFISSNVQLFKSKAILNWEFHGFYVPQSNLTVTGAQNNMQIALPVNRFIQLTATHQTIYNSYVDINISKVNTLLLFGISIHK